MNAAWAALAVFVLGAAFFASAELALLSTSRIRLRQWVQHAMQGERWIHGVDVIERPYRLLSPILVGRVLSVTAAALLAARIAAEHLDVGLMATSAAAALVLAPVIYLLEAVSGALARARGRQLFPVVSRILRACSWVFRPLVAAAELLTASLLRLLGAGVRPRGSSPRHVLESLLDESERVGIVEPAEREIIAGVFEFGRLPVRAVMKPRERMVVAPAGARAREISRLIRETGYSRIPLHGRRDRERIVGVVHVFDLLKLDPDESPHPRRVVVAAPDKPCDELLIEMKRRRSHLAIVAERRRAVGIVTMEDLVEVLVGEIRDEHDARAEGREPALVVDARTPISEINARHGTNFPTEGPDTVESLLMLELGRVPQAGEELRFRDWSIDVLEASPERVRRVRLQRRGAVPAGRVGHRVT